MAGYLSGSTINVTYKNNPQRYTGGYVTEDFFKIVGVSPVLGRDFTAEDNKPGAEKTVILGDEIWRRDFNADPTSSDKAFGLMASPQRSSASCRRASSSRSRRNFGRLYIMSFRRLRAAIFDSEPTTTRLRSWAGSKPDVTSRSSERGVCRDRAPFGGRQSEDKPEFHVGQRAAAAQCVHWRAIAPNGLGDARRGHSGFADRMRERDEHAIRPRRACARRNWRFAARSARPAGDSFGKC